MLDFPIEVREDIASIEDSGGVLSAERCHRICQKLSISIESLMIRLLPLAASYSKPVISSFQVGAVVRGVKEDSNGMASLYLGANLEFADQALCYSVHAEQSAISNAWSHNEPGVTAIAITAPPCGHCRQFLYEIVGPRSFVVLLPFAEESDIFSTRADPEQSDVPDFEGGDGDLINAFVSADLSQLLPAAFGPLDLGCDRLLMEPGFGTNHLKLLNVNTDDLVRSALEAADLSYAPYTANFAGCAIKLVSGRTFTGRYAENAAHNPSLSPFSAALAKMMLSTSVPEQEKIERVVLVEYPTKASQKYMTENLLATYDNGVQLEYHTSRQ